MEVTAAVLREQGSPLTIESLELDAPEAGEVLVEVKAAGVCHSDLHPALGDWPVPTPMVLGHEGAGVVRAVGPGVTRVSPGDTVVFCWAPPCGVCPPCRSGHPVLCDRLDKTAYSSSAAVGNRATAPRHRACRGVSGDRVLCQLCRGRRSRRHSSAAGGPVRRARDARLRCRDGRGGGDECRAGPRRFERRRHRGRRGRAQRRAGRGAGGKRADHRDRSTGGAAGAVARVWRDRGGSRVRRAWSTPYAT